MAGAKKWEGAARTATLPVIACFVGTASPQYPATGIGSTEYAARFIGVRHRLSPAVARTVVELVGIGGAS